MDAEVSEGALRRCGIPFDLALSVSGYPLTQLPPLLFAISRWLFFIAISVLRNRYDRVPYHCNRSVFVIFVVEFVVHS